jgi:uncharacterized membrane protein
MFNRIKTVLRHLWLDESDTRRTIDPHMLERLRQRVAASEARHTGEVRIYVEASLPLSYLWRHLRQKVPIRVLARQRATSMFGKLRVWDTEYNNGVLIYLLLAEHAIELVADRGLNTIVKPQEWRAMVQHMGAAFASGHFEDGLTQALSEVSAPLVRHFPAGPTPNPNDQPDTPMLG